MRLQHANATARPAGAAFADRRGLARLPAKGAAVVCCVLFVLAAARPAPAHEGDARSTTRAHQKADVPAYGAHARHALARKIDRARRLQRRAARAERLRWKRRRAAARRAGLTAPPTLSRLHQIRFASALGLPIEGTGAQSLRSGYIAFSGGTPDQLGEWSAPIDPAEPDSNPDGIGTPYDSGDLLPAASPPLPPGVNPGEEWDKGAVWGIFPKVVPVFTALLPNGKVLYWDWKKSGTPGADDAWPENTRVVLFDPATGVAKRSDPPFAANVFCAGYSHLPNGDLLLAGGNLTSNQLGIAQTFIYHWQTDDWSQGPDMTRKRWYPSVAGLATGESLILGGDPYYPNPPISELGAAVPEVYTSTFDAGAYDGGALRTLSNLPYPGNDIAPRSHRVYPYLAPALDGRVFYAGPDQEMFMIDTEGAGGSEMMLQARDNVYREYGSFAYVGKGRVLVGGGGYNAQFDRVPGPSYQMVAGQAFNHGTSQSTSLIDLLRDAGSETADPAQGLPESAASGNMAVPRRMHNMTVLPDGTVLATGGMSDTDPDNADCDVPVAPQTIEQSCPDPDNQNYNNQLYNPDDATKTAELWDPSTGAWTSLSAAAKVRQYHSIAMLMPDGRVLTGGGGICGACTQQNYFEPNFEIFTPPYLYKQPGDPGYNVALPKPAARPKITGPLTGGMLSPVAYGQQFSVDYTTDDGAGNGSSTAIDASTGSAVLMKLAAPTHGVDQGQRRVPASIVSGDGDSVTLTAPPNAYEAPPGFYLLFLVDGRGVPSKAVVIQVGAQLALANEHAAVTVHGAAGLTGGSQVLGLGVFKASDGNLADVGNDLIRSLKVYPGYQATVCTTSAGTDCAVAAAGEYAALSSDFDGKISYVKVEPANGATTDPRLTTSSGPTGPTGPTPPTGPTGGETDPPLADPRPVPTVKLGRSRRLAARLTFSYKCATRCTVSVKIAGGRRPLVLSGRQSSKGRVMLDAGRGRLTISLSQASLKALRADLRKRRRVTVTVTLTDADGQSASALARLR